MTSEDLVLGIETSCDETAAAVVRGGRQIVSSVVSSQDELHAPFGGVVPEVASRRHAELITLVVDQALRQAGVTWDELSALAVTRGPGLVGSLLVGVSAAKGYALATGLPVIGVNHIAAHMTSPFLTGQGIEAPAPETFPALGMVASGGHSDLVLIEGHGRYRLVGFTRDDAAGEALDKAARLLGLGYPGGPAIERAAREGNPEAVPLPRPDTRDGFEFSFAGLKTALVRIVEPVGLESCGYTVADLAASFQQAVVDSLVREAIAAARHFRVKQLLAGGGVAANTRLREDLSAAARDAGIPAHFPPRWLCTDNAAMVAAAAHHQALLEGPDDLSMEVDSALRLPA
ncbi:MAG TPA: tRNA (adenosine(37)-N6)-threonylcarbamoyltransferase complex transferase subunit TsaD [Armatimonadota bacterium]|nr:tRNA (adenosine(37)-N6)-threonylcarbamoyltransferase complex transferase subunit TsaD [Armatimonadota bacterium]